VTVLIRIAVFILFGIQFTAGRDQNPAISANSTGRTFTGSQVSSPSCAWLVSRTIRGGASKSRCKTASSNCSAAFGHSMAFEETGNHVLLQLRTGDILPLIDEGLECALHGSMPAGPLTQLTPVPHHSRGPLPVIEEINLRFNRRFLWRGCLLSCCRSSSSAASKSSCLVSSCTFEQHPYCPTASPAEVAHESACRACSAFRRACRSS